MSYLKYIPIGKTLSKTVKSPVMRHPDNGYTLFNEKTFGPLEVLGGWPKSDVR